MSDQGKLFQRSPEDLIGEAKERWRPVKTFCMFSGGDDSTVVAHRCREHYDALYHIDTGTGVEEHDLSVIAHVRQMAAELEKPLVIMPAGDAFERMVLGGTILRRGDRAGQVEEGHGFPGPGMHGKAYTRLKERQTEGLLRHTKRGYHREASVLLLSGAYSAESATRATRPTFSERGSAKYVNPLIDWTKGDMRRYRETHRLRQSDIAALLHRSGECNCGAYANAGEERRMLEQFCPRTFARIHDLELRAEAAGIRWCRWGGYDLDGVRSTEVSVEDVGPGCAHCALQMSMAVVA